MARRAATVSQVDVARTIRAMLAAGLTVTRVVTRADGVVIETQPLLGAEEQRVEPKRRPVL